MAAFVAMRYIHVVNDERPSNALMPLAIAMSAICVASSASCELIDDAMNHRTNRVVVTSEQRIECSAVSALNATHQIFVARAHSCHPAVNESSLNTPLNGFALLH